MMQNIDRIRSMIFVHEEHGQEQVTVEEMQRFDVYGQVREHIQVADHDDKTGGGVLLNGKGNMCKPSDNDSHGEESWVSWDSWIGWDEIEDSCRMGRPEGKRGALLSYYC